MVLHYIVFLHCQIYMIYTEREPLAFLLSYSLMVSDITIQYVYSFYGVSIQDWVFILMKAGRNVDAANRNIRITLLNEDYGY